MGPFRDADAPGPRSSILGRMMMTDSPSGRPLSRFVRSAGFARGAILAAALAGIAQPASAAPPNGQQIQGISIPGLPAVSETTGEIMARQMRLGEVAPQMTLDLFPGRADTSLKKVDPDAMNRRQGPATGPQSPEIATGASWRCLRPWA